MGRPIERTHGGLLLQALYPLHGKVPGLARVPVAARRATRRAITSAGVRAHLARCRRTTIVAVTGSMGKTTTKELLAEMLATEGQTVKTRKNDNGLYGVPASLLSIRPDDRFAVIEVAIEATPGEMHWMASLFRPRVAILTGIGDDHTSVYGSREAVAGEKRALLARVPRDGVVVVNADDELARRTARGLACRIMLAGTAEDADVRLVAVQRTRDGLTVSLAARGEEATASIALHGVHLAPLVAIAAAAAIAVGVPLRRALDAAARFEPPPGRMAIARASNGALLVRDHYKSRVATAVAAIRAFGELEADRRIVVIGEVQERAHTTDTYEPVAAELSRVADVVIAVGRCGPPLRELLGSSLPLLELDTVDAVAVALEGELRASDAVLLHGSTRQHLERIDLLLEHAPVGCLVRRCKFHWICTDCPHLASGPPASAVEAA